MPNLLVFQNKMSEQVCQSLRHHNNVLAVDQGGVIDVVLYILT